jgi:hypothetical protein
MTMTDVTSNGHGSTGDRARQLWRQGMSGAELGRQLGVPERTGSYWAKKLNNEVGKADDKPSSPAVDRPATRAPRARQQQPATRRQRDPWQVVCTGVVLAVGLAVSYSHIVHLALLAGGGWWAWVMPLPLDGMALVSLRHLEHERSYPVAWAGVAVGAAGSLTANVLAIDPTLADLRYVRWGFAALPPIAVVLCGHLLDRGSR